MKKQRNRTRIAVVLGLVVLAAALVAAAAVTRPVLAESQPIRAAQHSGSGIDLATGTGAKPGYRLARRAGLRRRIAAPRCLPSSPSRAPTIRPTDVCQDDTCQQVDIFAFDQLATVTAIVHLGSNKVVDAWLVPNSHPLANPRLYNRAVEIIRNDA